MGTPRRHGPTERLPDMVRPGCAFNEWAKGSFLEDPAKRDVTTIALSILHGAAVTLRLSSLRTQGVPVPESARRILPLERERLP